MSYTLKLYYKQTYNKIQLAELPRSCKYVNISKIYNLLYLYNILILSLFNLYVWIKIYILKKKKHLILLIPNLINYFRIYEIACFHLNWRLMFHVLKKVKIRLNLLAAFNLIYCLVFIIYFHKITPNFMYVILGNK